MSAITEISIIGLFRNIENVILKIANSLDISAINDSKNDNLKINKILDNPQDEYLFIETVEYLKKHKEIKEKEISLSNNELLTISLE